MLRRQSSLSVVHTFKHLLLQNRLANQSQNCVEPLWVGGTKVCSRYLGHLTKMAATPIYCRIHSKIFLSRTCGPISTKHRGLGSIIVCSNDDLWLTLTYFTARSSWVTLAFLYTLPHKPPKQDHFWSSFSLIE